jgi:hypothetical protein
MEVTMRNVTISSAVSYELFKQAKEVALRYGLSLSRLIELSIRQLLALDPATLEELCKNE